MNKIIALALLFSCSIAVEQAVQAHGGGAVAGGVFGGLALGSILASSNRPRETVIYERQPAYVPEYIYVTLGDDGFYYDQFGNQVPGPQQPVNRRMARRERRRGDNYRQQPANRREVRRLQQDIAQDEQELADIE